MDDNVHMQNTMQFVNELQKNNKQFDLMVYPTAAPRRYKPVTGQAYVRDDDEFYFEEFVRKAKPVRRRGGVF